MTPHPHIAGVILAGGEARRMFAGGGASGGDKGLLDLAGKPMLAHVIARVKPQVATLVLNANGEAARFSDFGLEVLADHPAARGQGPLAGLLAAMAWARDRAHAASGNAIATVSGDVPFLPDDVVARLEEQRGGNAGKLAIAVSDGRRHPTIGLWPLALMDDLAETLARGELSADRFAKRHGAIEVSFPMRNIGGREADPFFNANTPDDLERARALLVKNN